MFAGQKKGPGGWNRGANGSGWRAGRVKQEALWTVFKIQWETTTECFLEMVEGRRGNFHAQPSPSWRHSFNLPSFIHSLACPPTFLVLRRGMVRPMPVDKEQMKSVCLLQVETSLWSLLS